MRFTSKTFFLFALAVTVATGLVSCKPKADKAGETKILYRGNSGEPGTLDPHISTGILEANITRDLFLGLLTDAENGSAIPGAAESWNVSDDGLVYTFHLRKDNQWSDGTPLTADDFVYSFRRILEPKLAAKYASILYPIKNAKALNTKKLEGMDKLGVKAVDPQTLQITLEAPTPYFLTQLKHHTAYPVPKHVIEKFGKDWVKAKNFVSNGPYLLSEWKAQDYIKLIKNERFYDKKNVQIEEIYYYPTEDRKAALQRFRAGELDMNSDFLVEEYPWLKKNMNKETRVSPYLGTYYYAINQRLPKFQDKRVREALIISVDRKTIVEKVLASGQTPAYSFVPVIAGYQIAEFNFKDMPMQERIERAKQLLKDAGYTEENPLQLEISYNTSDNHKKVAVAVAAMWKEIGVETKLSNSETAVHFSNLKQGKYQIGRASWIGDYPDAQNFLMLLEYPSKLNYSGYQNAQFNELMATAAKTVDLKKRAKILHQAEQLMLDDFAILPIYYYISRNLVSTQIKGWKANAEDIHPTRWISK